MKAIISLALLVVGIVFIILGVQASTSLSSDLSQFFTGSPTDKTIWMFLGGVVLAVIGLSGVTFRNRIR